MLREGVERDSERLGELKTGAVVEALESGFGDGVRRIRTKDGWASVLSAKGTPLLQRCSAPTKKPTAEQRAKIEATNERTEAYWEHFLKNRATDLHK